MNLKKVNKKLSQIRDSAQKNGCLTDDAREQLKTLVQETISVAQKDLKKKTSIDILKIKQPIAHNDNNELTADQHFRLRLMEKTGTGSHAIH